MIKGFTLIELLVTVLIIGILASLAVPQYTKVIKRTEFAQTAALLKSIYDSSKRYKETYSQLPGKIEEMDIKLPDGAQHIACKFDATGADCYRMGNFDFVYSKTESVQAHPIKGKTNLADVGDYSNYAYTITWTAGFSDNINCVVVPSALEPKNAASADKWCSYISAKKTPKMYGSARVYVID